MCFQKLTHTVAARHFRQNLCSLMSIIYAFFIISLGAIFTLMPESRFYDRTDQVQGRATGD